MVAAPTGQLLVDPALASCQVQALEVFRAVNPCQQTQSGMTGKGSLVALPAQEIPVDLPAGVVHLVAALKQTVV